MSDYEGSALELSPYDLFLNKHYKIWWEMNKLLYCVQTFTPNTEMQEKRVNMLCLSSTKQLIIDIAGQVFLPNVT